MRAGARRTSGYPVTPGFKSQLSPAHSPSSAALAQPGFWTDLLAAAARRLPNRRRRLRVYAELIDSGAMAAAAAAYAELNLALEPPVRRTINRAGGRRKTLFLFGARDELFLRALNTVLQPLAAPLHSPLCHSFQAGRGVRTAYHDLLRRPGLDTLAWTRMDVRDYFNSIPPDRLLERLPEPLGEDPALVRFLTSTLLDQRVVSDGEQVLDDHKGAMAGTPLAPLLANLYLAPLDDYFEGQRVLYARYADDFIVFGTESEVAERAAAVAGILETLGLELNTRKTRSGGPGEPWEFLGLSYDRGRLDLAYHTVRKLHGRTRRMARRARRMRDPLGYFVRRLNRRLFGAGGDPADFTWGTWFFPMLSGDASLRRLDAVIQAQARFAGTGRHERRNHRAVPYARLLAAGYLPLAAAFHAHARGRGEYLALLEARCRVRDG
ncbi:MAG: reverse transcriptase domain-containing protein [Chloroflexota bacterium]